MMVMVYGILIENSKINFFFKIESITKFSDLKIDLKQY
jgi:hypothetical protein